ncbi:MAG: dephospho-CoA kinase [Cloacibacillus sp.]
MPIIGLTGDVGAGKSTLCSVWRVLGAHIIDADSAARALWDAPDVRCEAEKRWGEGFFDAPRRELYSKIAQKIFTDEEEYKFAAELLHKRTNAQIKAEALASGGVVVVEIPLLYECGDDEWLDYVIYAAAPLARRAERNAKRSWNAEEIKRRESKLLPREEKMKRADKIVTNSGTEEEWRALAAEVWRELETVKAKRG